MPQLEIFPISENPPWSFKFSTHDRRELRKALKKYASDRRDKFIDKLENLCRLAMYVQDSPTPSDLLQQNDKILDQLENTLNLLKSIADGNNIVIFPRKVPSDFNFDGWLYFEDTRDATEILAGKSINFLQQLIEKIKKVSETIALQLKHGRPLADDNDLIKAIALDFEKILGDKPTNYKDGAFFAAARTTLAAIGQPAEYPSRAIKRALKQLSIISPNS